MPPVSFYKKSEKLIKRSQFFVTSLQSVAQIIFIPSPIKVVLCILTHLYSKSFTKKKLSNISAIKLMLELGADFEEVEIKQFNRISRGYMSYIHSASP